MAGGRKETTIRAARGWLGTMLVAWTLVSGCAVVIASAYYYRTQDIRLLITWLAPPFLLGCVIFLGMGLVSLVGSVRDEPVEVVNQRGTRQSIFREQR